MPRYSGLSLVNGTLVHSYYLSDDGEVLQVNQYAEISRISGMTITEVMEQQQRSGWEWSDAVNPFPGLRQRMAV